MDRANVEAVLRRRFPELGEAELQQRVDAEMNRPGLTGVAKAMAAKSARASRKQ